MGRNTFSCGATNSFIVALHKMLAVLPQLCSLLHTDDEGSCVAALTLDHRWHGPGLFMIQFRKQENVPVVGLAGKSLAP